MVSSSCSVTNTADNTDDNMLMGDMLMLMKLLKLGGTLREWPGWDWWPSWHRHRSLDIFDEGHSLFHLLVFLVFRVKLKLKFFLLRGRASSSACGLGGSSVVFFVLIELKKIAINAIVIVIIIIVLAVGANNNWLNFDRYDHFLGWRGGGVIAIFTIIIFALGSFHGSGLLCVLLVFVLHHQGLKDKLVSFLLPFVLSSLELFGQFCGLLAFEFGVDLQVFDFGLRHLAYDVKNLIRI